MTTNAGGLKGDIVATIASVREPEEEALTRSTINDELRLIDGIEIEANGNPILVEMAALAQSDDLVNTQRNIVAYESGDASFYRSLHRILNIGKIIMQSDAGTITAAFSYLSEAISNKNTQSKDGGAVLDRGFKNIGIADLPAINEKSLRRIKEDSLFLYKTLIGFYFPNSSATMRGKYYTVINWAYTKDEPNFVTWLAGGHEINIGGNIVKKRGLKGAYQKIKETQAGKEDETKLLSSDEVYKVFENTNKVIAVAAPQWINECVQDTDEPFMILGRLVGNELRLVNYTTSNTSHIKASIKEAQGALFPSDLDYRKGNPVIKMVDAIKNIIPFTAPAELIMWQDSNGGTYLMPLYDEWINDGSPEHKETNSLSHFAVIVDLFNAYGADGAAVDTLLFLKVLDTDFCNDSDVTKFGYITNQLDDIRSFRGNAYKSFKWINDDQSVFEFMGAQWFLSPTRRPKRRTPNDIRLKRTRLPTIPPYGHKYLMACKFIEDGKLKYGELISHDIDFALARAVYKNWVEARKEGNQGIHQEYLTICVKSGEIGVWFDNVTIDGITHYDNHNELVKIGTLPHTPTMKGQWRIQTYQLRRVWNLLTGPWEMYSPYSLESVRHFKEDPLDFSDALEVMGSEPELPFGSMQNLHSMNENDDGCKFNVHIKAIDSAGNDGDIIVETRRMCVPLIFRCGALWLYLSNDTR